LILYVDTSVLVAAHTGEARTADMQAWLGRRGATALAISGWVIAEFSAALSKKQRVGEIDGAYRAYALAEFKRVTVPSLAVLEIRSSDFRTAARYADQYATGLRAADALHLAIASGHAAALHTLDERLAKAGLALGVRTVLL
jgi:predicted nucleic acid-binding protein